MIALRHVPDYKRRVRGTNTAAWIYQATEMIESSDKVHVVDALAITGEEGRVSLRKAWGSWQ